MMGDVKLNEGNFSFSDFSLQLIYANITGIRDPLKQDLTLGFCRNQNKRFSILTETHINHGQIHKIRNNLLGPIFFCPGDSHTKWLLVLLHPGLGGVTEFYTDPKRSIASFKVSPSNDRNSCQPGYITNKSHKKEMKKQ